MAFKFQNPFAKPSVLFSISELKICCYPSSAEMKFAGLSSLLQDISRFGTRNRFHSNFYSSKAVPSNRYVGPRKGKNNDLFHRIAPIGDPKVSIVPVLDQWIEEGQFINRESLNDIIKELRFYKRYGHALEISMWMTDKRYYYLTSSDVAIRLDLISRCQGVEQAEKYFNNVPQKLKDLKVYGALLNCYATAKWVEKAEAVMRKMRGLVGSGFDKKPLAYNTMLTLYFKTGNMEKFNSLLREMEEIGIARDKFTVAIQLSAYAAVKDIEGMDKMVSLMESDPNIVPDWTSYAAAANGYRKAGLMDKALEMLKKSEAIATTRRRCSAYNFLFTQYASIGRKDEVLRLWSVYKKKEKVYNKGFSCVISSLVKFGDFEMAEQVFDEWESQDRIYDMSIPNILIGSYCSKALFEKAEALIDRVMSKGGKPNAWTWYYFATGYLENDQPKQALEMMKRALVRYEPLWRPQNNYLAACLEYLKGVGDLEQAEEFVKSLLEKSIISSDIQEKLLNAVKAEKSLENGALLELMEAEEKIENESEMFI